MKLTDAALIKLKELREDQSHVLIISILSGGCSGFSYHMKWQDYRIPYDKQVFVGDSLIIGTDKRSALFLEDLILDYEGGLNGTGFKYTNPLAKRVCGCGSSFST